MRQAIERKRDGESLRAQEWHAAIEGYLSGAIDEAQMAALCMACVWRGMSLDEAHALTEAMVESGERLHFDIGAPVIDKHSSGGVSDVVSLVAVPVAAAAGAHVAKLSGRALGHTGGTIDKLETIPGFNAALSSDAFVRQVARVGCAIAAQTQRLVPADKRLYALRDRTGTVPAMGLIAASMVSKKVAGGADAFVFDVKTGRAAFMRDEARAGELARMLVDISARFDRRATAFVTDMDQPLGQSIGTGLEILEARQLLQPQHAAQSSRAMQLVLAIVDAMLEAAEIDDGERRAREALRSGAAYEKFVEMLCAQGASREGFEAMQAGSPRETLRAPHEGYVRSIDVVRLGNVGRELSAREPFGGLRIRARIGDRVERGAPLLEIYGPDLASGHGLDSAIELTADPVPAPPLIHAKIAPSPNSRPRSR